jgi:hypothetical protein
MRVSIANTSIDEDAMMVSPGDAATTQAAML